MTAEKRDDVVVFWRDGMWGIHFLHADGSRATYPLDELNKEKKQVEENDTPEFGAIPDGPKTTWQDSPNRIRRAKRLLAKAEAEDTAKANYAVARAEIERVSAERQAAKQAEADEWSSIFARHGLEIEAAVQTTSWIGGFPEPEIWLHARDREASWARLVDLLRSIDPSHHALVTATGDPGSGLEARGTDD